uniref:Uncharacterized protein n=1 Tax=Ascaris lumbricoides TaxID=6252 RepID=A0A9J2PP83_ASCLU
MNVAFCCSLSLFVTLWCPIGSVENFPQDDRLMQKRFQSLALLRNGRLYLAEENGRSKGKRTEIDEVLEANGPFDEHFYWQIQPYGTRRFYLPSWIF